MKEPVRVYAPLAREIIKTLGAGDQVLLNGSIYIGRDAVHKKFVETLDRGEKLPVDLQGQIIFYAGPCPPRPGYPLGPTGPTTASRMDPYTPQLLEQTGLAGMLAKGRRAPEVVEAIRRHGAAYFVCTAGVAALLTQSIKKYEILAYPELGPEALARIEVVDFPALVGVDCLGNDFFETCRQQYGGQPG